MRRGDGAAQVGVRECLATAERRGRQRAPGAEVVAPIQNGIGESGGSEGSGESGREKWEGLGFRSGGPGLSGEGCGPARSGGTGHLGYLIQLARGFSLFLSFFTLLFCFLFFKNV